MRFFKDFEKVQYSFGNEVTNVLFQNLTSYADIVDQIKDDAGLYQFEQIHEGFRPDQLSIRLYGTPLYYWTFYLMNDNLRLQGWPLTNVELEAKVKERYAGTVITTKNDLTGIFKIGRTVVGTQSGATGTIIHRNLEMGQIVVTGDLTFKISPTPEAVTSTYQTVGGTQATATDTITITGYSEYYNAAHHYIDGSGNRTDFDPAVGPGAQLTEVTNFENYINENEALRNIRVIRPGLINDVISAYKKSIRS